MAARIATSLLTALLVATTGAGWARDIDWAEVGSEARERAQPVAMLVTGPDCGYCVRLHQEFLDAPATRGTLERATVLHEISRDEGGKVIDFDGERVRSRLFLARYEIFATPTLLLLSPEGELLASPIVGFNGPQAYGDLVAKRLKGAQHNLASGQRPSRDILAISE